MVLRTTLGGLLQTPQIGQAFDIELQVFETHEREESDMFIIAVFSDTGVQLYNRAFSENFTFNVANNRTVRIPGLSQRVGRIEMYIWDRGTMRPLAEQYVRNF